MINFKTPQLSDKEWVREILRSGGSFGCEYTFGNIIIWGPNYSAKISRYKDLLTILVPDSDSFLCFYPIGKGDKKELIEKLGELADNAGKQLEFLGLTEEKKSELEKIYPERFEFRESRDDFDYLYNREDLAELKGRNYRAKRNHISFFEKNHEWQYEETDNNNLEECYDMLLEWAAQADGENTALMNETECAKRAIQCFDELDFFGGLIRADGKVAAFTIAEKLNDFTADVHIEKAFKDMRGSYAIINREFARHNAGLRIIDREDDAGAEGLRKSKLSYHPQLLKKYIAVKK